jgi:peroxiredoxin
MDVTAADRAENHLNPGDAAPDVPVSLAETGESLSLARLWQDGPAVLVFLRHLGCVFCREHVAELRKITDRFIESHATVGLITTGQASDTAEFCAERSLQNPFVCLCDPDRAAYRAFGLAKCTSGDFYTAHVWRRAFQATLHGHILGMPKGDPYQMPGVFVIDRTGVVRYSHYYKDASDNPPNADLLAALTAAGY